MQDLSKKTCANLYHKKRNDQLSYDLEMLKSKFANADFNFKKYEGSRKKHEQMIESQMKQKENKGIGLGFQALSPSYNQNYTTLPLSNDEIYS